MFVKRLIKIIKILDKVKVAISPFLKILIFMKSRRLGQTVTNHFKNFSAILLHFLMNSNKCLENSQNNLPKKTSHYLFSAH